MKIIKRIINTLKNRRVLYSIYFNYKYLPMHQAKHLPIIFYKNAYAKISHGGKIILSDDMIARKCKVYIGVPVLDFEYQCEKTFISIYYGTLIIDGKFEMRRGACINVKGNLKCGHDVLFGPRSRVRVYNEIILGNHVRIAHETQIFDTNFHYMEKIENPGFIPISKPVYIGSYCWIGNRSTLNLGTILPDYTIVASNSLVNKDFSSLNPYSIIGGIPAKFLKEGYTRVWDMKKECEYQQQEFEWAHNLWNSSM